MINTGRIKYDRIYSFSDIFSELNISRTPVRDAIQMLNDEKRIEVLPSRGFRLRRITRDEVLDLCHFSIALEGYCAASMSVWVAENSHQECIARLSSLVEQMESCDMEHMSFSDFFELDNQFHCTVVKSMNNSVFDELLRSPGGFYNRPEMHIADNYEDRQAIAREHRSILDAILSGDPQAAFSALKYHGETLYQRYLSMDNASSN